MNVIYILLTSSILFLSKYNMCDYVYSFKLKVYYKNQLVKNDSLSFYDHPSPESKMELRIDSKSTITCNVIVKYPCSTGNSRFCKERNTLDCDIYVSTPYNTDSLTFGYKNKYLKIKNRWADILKLRREGKPYNEIVYEDTLRFH